MLVIFEKIVFIFLIIGIGFVFGRAKLIPHEAQKYFSYFLINLCLPCMILSSITEKELTESTLSDTVYTLLFSAAYFVLLTLTALFLSKYVFKVPREDLGAYILLFSTNNTGFLGFPVTAAIFGNGILFYMIVFNITLTIQCNSLGPVLINIGAGNEKFDFKKSFRAFLNVNTVCSVLALVMFFLKLHFPPIIFECLDSLGSVTVSLSVFIIGMQLSESDFRHIIKNFRLVGMALIKMFIIPFLMFLIVSHLNISSGLKICFILASSLPTAAATTPIAQTQGRNALLCAEYVAFTTLISLVVIPLVSTILTNRFL